MRAKLKLVLKQLDQHCWNEAWAQRVANRNLEFHLVVTNFFPWVTRKRWNKIPTNCLGEAIVLRCWSTPNAATHIADLIQQIDSGSSKKSCAGEVPIIAFHGVDNAVPLLAEAVIKECLAKPVYTNFVFCDNLSPSPNPIPSNAVTLLPFVPFSLKYINVDEVDDS
jgi:hypothetical protein